MSHVEIILLLMILMNIIALWTLSKRIDITHKRISLICEGNGLRGKDWGKKNDR